MDTFFTTDKIEAGCDEAGRGCLAGPVVAAAVILPKSCIIEGLDDSKKLTSKQRKQLVPIIKEKAIAFSVAFVDQHRIDKINILNASFEAMHNAVDDLEVVPELLLIDGNRFNPHPKFKHECITKGDAKFLSIAAASVLAKEARDDYMKTLDSKFPQYGWQKNMGYPTKQHKEALKRYGLTDFHRKTFKF
ncbi:MAG: ribonuclease HII [Brumimicrobium sp.]